MVGIISSTERNHQQNEIVSTDLLYISFCGGLRYQRAGTPTTPSPSSSSPLPYRSTTRPVLSFASWQILHLGREGVPTRATAETRSYVNNSRTWHQSKLITNKGEHITIRLAALPALIKHFIEQVDDHESELETSPHHQNEQGRIAENANSSSTKQMMTHQDQKLLLTASGKGPLPLTSPHQAGMQTETTRARGGSLPSPYVLSVWGEIIILGWVKD